MVTQKKAGIAMLMSDKVDFLSVMWAIQHLRQQK